jgi:hypothetical protein
MPPPHTRPSTQALAREFARHLRAAIHGKHVWTHIEAANRGRYTRPGQDAVHNHLDPWTVMHDAWNQITREPMRVDDAGQTALIEAAMHLSKQHNHDPAKIPLA